MSSYSCVVPVNWNVLWEQVLPAWLSVLSGSLAASEFYARYVPGGDEFGGFLEENYSASFEDLSQFTAPLQPPYLRANLHDSGKCSTFLQPDFPYLLEAAIKQTAAVNLPGSDPFAGNYFASFDTPSGRMQVAGTKNSYSFLESAFEENWKPRDSLYTYSRRQNGGSVQLQELLEALFLYQCVIPGTWFPSQSPAWPGYDDLSFAGYLSPTQVKSLKDQLAIWEVPSLVHDDEFLLFSDRVKRSAESNCGLLTIHAGL